MIFQAYPLLVIDRQLLDLFALGETVFLVLSN